MIRYEATAINQFDDASSGNAASGVTVTVRDKTTGVKPTLYIDDGVTETTNPIMSSADGTFFFYVEDGFYSVIISEGEKNEKKLKDVEIFSGLDKQRKQFIYVTDFGAADDQTDTIDQTALFDAAAAAAGESVPVFVPAGSYRLESATTNKATWILTGGTKITGLPRVAPTVENDTSYLTGTRVKYFDPDEAFVLALGETDFAHQKLRGRGAVGTLSAVSHTGDGGVYGGSNSSKSDTANQSCIGVTGVVLNDNTTTPRSAWGVYGEAVQEPGAGGNTYAAEFAIHNNGNSLVRTDPNTQPDDGAGITAGIWTSCGVAGGNPVSAWATVLETGGTSQFDKGLLFYANSLVNNADYREAISFFDECATVWYPKNGVANETQGMAWIKGRDKGADGSGRIAITVKELNVGGVPRCDYQFEASQLAPTDNQANLGTATNRWKEVFSVNGTINTSDSREKQQQRSLSEVEKTVATAIKGMVKAFKWNDAVADKGVDARWHFGVMAQDVAQVFTDNGLNPDDYGLFCYDSWEEHETESGEIVPAGDRYGVRYTELMMFILGAL